MKNIDWASLSFGYMPTDYNVRCYYRNGSWGEIEVSSSEYIPMHMAATCDVVHLAQIIMELCGTYAISPIPNSDGHSPCRYGLHPVTTLTRIASYAHTFRMRGGTKTLRAALHIAMDGSASPAETTLSLAMSLPHEMGGYGFPTPILNAEVSVPESFLGKVGGATYRPDAFWQGAYSDLEYQSTEYHLDPLAATALVAAHGIDPRADPEAAVWRRGLISKADADQRRMRDLQSLGLHVIPVTSFDLQSVRRLDQVAYALLRQFEKHASWDVCWSADERFAELDEHTWYQARRILLQELQPSITVLP